MSEAAIQAAADAIRPLFRHGGGGGSTGISYGWNPDEEGFGIWDHEADDWFPGQPWANEVGEIDGPRYFAKRALIAANALPPEQPPT